MRKLVNYIVFIVMLLVLPFVVNAASANVGISCPSSAKVGETISCNINITTDVKVNGLVLNYTFNGASYVSFTPSSGFTAQYTSANGFNVGNNAGKSGSYTIGVLKVKVSSATTIMLKNIDISDTGFNSYTSVNKSATIRLKSTNVNLGGLSLSSGSLSPAFNANTTSYTATIDATSVTINASKAENTQAISGTGKKTLKYGKNTFKVVVTSEAGTTKTYTIVITRPDKRKTDNYLKSLSVDKGSISFKKETLTYSVKVAKDVSSIVVSAAVNDSTASFVKGYGPRTVNLNYGVNNVLVKVQAENETVRTYTIKVTREDDRSSNNNLSSITLSNGNISFSKDVTEYNVNVPYTVTKIDVVGTPEDSKSKVSVESPNLVVGENIVTVTVTAENGQSKVYKIKVNRLAEQAVLSDNNNVSSIDIKGHGIEFNQDTNEYEISIGDEYALVIDVLLEDPSAKYAIEGNEDLKDGSVITITSTSESGEVKEYKINVKKELAAVPRSNGNGLISGLIGFVLGLFTMFMTITLLNKMKSKKVAVATAGSAPAVKETAKVGAPVAETKPAVAAVPEPKPAVVSTPPKVEAAPVVEEKAAPVAPAATPAPKPAPAPVQPAATPAPKPAVSATATEAPKVETVATATKTVTAPAPATTTTTTAPAPAAKPVMLEADVLQPVSKTANVIPDNK